MKFWTIKEKLNWRIDRNLLIYLIIGFIVATIIGTISHEFGHYCVAKILGYDAKINYSSTDLIIKSNGKIIPTYERFFITLGGPLQTILTGTIGFILLIVFRRSYQRSPRLTILQWTVIFISLFWLRQSANFFAWLGNYLFTGKFSAKGDEVKLSRYLEIPEWVIITSSAFIGLIVLIIVIFRFIPENSRFTFIISGLSGGVLGYLVWLEWLGKMVMP